MAPPPQATQDVMVDSTPATDLSLSVPIGPMVSGPKEEFVVVETTELFQHRFWTKMGISSLHAMQPFAAGSVMCPFYARSHQPAATTYTVQLGENEHIDLGPEILRFANHSCEPNFFFNPSTLQAEVLRDIQKGEQVCFFYPSTEWHMTSPFDCLCGTAACIGRVAGAKHINRDTLARYRLSKHIQNLTALSPEAAAEDA